MSICRFHRLTLLSVVLLGLVGCASRGVYNPVTGRSEFSALDEAQLRQGAEQAREALIDEHGLYPQPALQAYVTEIGLKVARVSHRPEGPWSFTILDSDASNAFALPGGMVFVTRGLLAHLQDEAELAAVLGHEIAHITARHGAHIATGTAFANVGVQAAVTVGQFLERQGMRGAAGRLSRFGLSLANRLIATYSREQELEADRIGTEYLARAGYGAREMIGVLKVLMQVERFHADHAAPGANAARASGWLASHPDTERRLRDAARQTAAALPVAEDGRGRYLDRIEGLVWGDSPERGLVRNRLFVHPRAGYAITAPPDWDIDVEGAAVAMHTPANDATLTVRLLPRLAGETHAQVIQNLLAPTQGQSSERRIGAFKGTLFVGSRIREGVRHPLRATVVSGPDRRLFLLDCTGRDEAALQRALPQMQAAEQSFRALTQADRTAGQVWRITTAAMPAGGFAVLARSAPPLLEQAEATFRLLNGVYGLDPAADPPVGWRVKTVR